jgi:AcrR family transcriptional regulator
MTPKKNDRRVNRTRAIMFQAISELMLEKRYEDITVQDIIDRADVGRSTFYAHFQDKEDLAVSNLIHMLDLMAGAMETQNSQGFLPGLGLFEHIRENYTLFKAMTIGRGLDLFFQKGQEYWSTRVASRLQAMLPAGQVPKVPIPILAYHVSGTFVNLLRWWMDNKMPYSSEQMAEIVNILVMPSVEAGLFGTARPVRGVGEPQRTPG